MAANVVAIRCLIRGAGEGTPTVLLECSLCYARRDLEAEWAFSAKAMLNDNLTLLHGAYAA
jgi:hypothetical protein